MEIMGNQDESQRRRGLNLVDQEIVGVSPYFENKILIVNFGELFSHYFDRVGFLLILQKDQRKP